MAVSCIRHELCPETPDALRVKGSRTDHLPVPSDAAQGVTLIDPQEERFAGPLCFGSRLNEVEPPGDLEPAFFVNSWQDRFHFLFKRGPRLRRTPRYQRHDEA